MKSSRRVAKQDQVTYDKIAPHYDQAMAPLERWFLGKLRAATLRKLPAHARLLEVGAGTGLNFAYYPEATSGVAIEPSSNMLQIAKGKLALPNIALVQSCAERLPFADDSFDAAFATLVFCSVTQPDDAFAELRRVVKAGGSVVLLEHVRPGGLLGPIFDLLSLFTVMLFDDHFNRRTATIASANGLKVESVERRFLGILNLIECRV
jgi:ubiquinone/menaquinone biosynthesis C-methylase UbiE